MAIRRHGVVATVAAVALAALPCAGAAASTAGFARRPSTSATTLAANAHGSWHFDETSGKEARDDSGFGNHGDVIGSVPRRHGYLGGAYLFGASGSWVKVAHDSSISPSTANFSFTARINLSRLPSGDETFDVVRKGLTSTRGGEFKVEILKDGKVRCIAKDANRVRAAITGTSRMRVTVGAWYSVGCERTRTSWSVVVNGVKRPKNVSLGSINNTLTLSIGSNYGKEDFVKGLVDEVELDIG